MYSSTPAVPIELQFVYHGLGSHHFISRTAFNSKKYSALEEPCVLNNSAYLRPYHSFANTYVGSIFLLSDLFKPYLET